MHVGWGLAEEKFVRSSSGIRKPIRVVPKLAFDPASVERALNAGEAYAQNPPSLPAVVISVPVEYHLLSIEPESGAACETWESWPPEKSLPPYCNGRRTRTLWVHLVLVQSRKAWGAPRTGSRTRSWIE